MSIRLHRMGRWQVALVVAFGVVGLAALPPFVGETARSVIMHGFSGVCHQLPERSLRIGSIPLAVCDRCLGIYAGAALGVLLLPGVRGMAARLHQRIGWVLLLSLGPLTVDWAGPVLGLWPNVPLSRFGTGGVFGVVSGLLVAYLLTRIPKPVGG